MIPAGLQAYYGGAINIGGVPYSVDITADTDLIDVQRVIIKRIYGVSKEYLRQ